MRLGMLNPAITKESECVALKSDVQRDFMGPDEPTPAFQQEVTALRTLLVDEKATRGSGSVFTLQHHHLSQVLMNYQRTNEPVMVHLYADFSEAFPTAESLHGVARTEKELMPHMWQIGDLHEIYTHMIRVKAAEVRVNMKRRIVLCLNVHACFKGKTMSGRVKSEQHSVYITLQWDKKKEGLIAVYEDLGYSVMQRELDAKGTVKGHDGNTYETKYLFSHRIYTKVGEVCHQLEIELQHTMRYPYQPYSVNMCGISLLLQRHVCICDDDRYQLFLSFRYHLDYLPLYKKVHKSQSKAPGIDDRTCQELMLRLYDQYLTDQFPDLWSNAVQYAYLFETDVAAKDRSVCCICGQVDTPSQLIACENTSHVCNKKTCSKRCSVGCSTYQHSFCFSSDDTDSPSADDGRPWYCKPCQQK